MNKETKILLLDNNRKIRDLHSKIFGIYERMSACRVEIMLSVTNRETPNVSIITRKTELIDMELYKLNKTLEELFELMNKNSSTVMRIEVVE